ncbi:MAG: 23S rRNA (uracil(1939)-C(5))-methyltransferase RlmD [Myxococcota bacterium]
MGRRKRLPPFECEIDRLTKKGHGLGQSPFGPPVVVRFAPVGGRVAVVPQGRKKGQLLARRTALIRPPPDAATPACPQFLRCGGCVLQEMTLEAQRRAKVDWGLSQVPSVLEDGPTVHPVRGTEAAYGYRNKVELSFGVRQWVREAEKDTVPIEGRFLGFHAPGRFDRVVDAPTCALVSDAMNRVIDIVRTYTLRPTAPPPYHPYTHEGFWRHLRLREADDGILAVIFTTSGDPAPVVELAEALQDHAVGVQWHVNDGVADVARGEVARTWGRPHLIAKLGPLAVQVSPTSFLQTNTAGCVVLYDTIGEAIGSSPGATLLDLYCGAGSIGLYLASQLGRVVGVEEVAAAVEDAKRNAIANGIEATFTAARVEHALEQIVGGEDVRIVVDPPRAGLHPKVARALAQTQAPVLVYVACHPGSLGRDAEILREGGWKATDLWPVDLFPQTGHLELVARFVR